MHLFADIDEFFKPVNDLIEGIEDDLRTRELLRTIIDDEYATVKWWFVQMHESLRGRATQG